MPDIIYTVVRVIQVFLAIGLVAWFFVQRVWPATGRQITSGG